MDRGPLEPVPCRLSPDDLLAKALVIEPCKPLRIAFLSNEWRQKMLVVVFSGVAS